MVSRTPAGGSEHDFGRLGQRGSRAQGNRTARDPVVPLVPRSTTGCIPQALRPMNDFREISINAGGLLRLKCFQGIETAWGTARAGGGPMCRLANCVFKILVHRMSVENERASR